jgi:hypothetical protein
MKRLIAKRGPWSEIGLMTRRWESQKGLCCYCEKPMVHPLEIHPKSRVLVLQLATKEHLKRRENGGESDINNISLAHSRPCNGGREDLPWNIWKSVCLGEWTPHEAIIACGEIGVDVPRFKSLVRNQMVPS